MAEPGFNCKDSNGLITSPLAGWVWVRDSPSLQAMAEWQTSGQAEVLLPLAILGARATLNHQKAQTSPLLHTAKTD